MPESSTPMGALRMLFLLFLLGKLRVMEDILGVVIVLEPVYELAHLRKRLGVG